MAEILRLVMAVRERMLHHARPRGRVGRIIPSINPFIPKPQTPFQWSPMAPLKELNRKMRWLAKALGAIPNVDVRCKSPRQERLQALLSLGDRRLAPAMLDMARGQTLRKALERHGLDLAFYVYRARTVSEILPWDVVDNGMKKELLITQFHKAEASPEEPYSATTNATA
ncbi:MAG: hypothetical protein GY953_24950 [bacterium]|nr:hypothetical protein [bacterium]